MKRTSIAVSRITTTGAWLVTPSVVGCAGHGLRSAFDGSDPDAGATGPTAGPGSPDALGSGEAGAPPPPAAPGKLLVYAHTDTTLFQTTKFAGAGITTTAPVIAPPAVN